MVKFSTDHLDFSVFVLKFTLLASKVKRTVSIAICDSNITAALQQQFNNPLIA